MKPPSGTPAWTPPVRRGDSIERERFVEAHLDVVRYLALRIATRLPSSLEVDDLIHDGVVGLLDAVERYDPTRNVRFRTYAEARVRGAILDGLRRRDWRPRSVRRGQRELDETMVRVSSLHGRAATEDEIAAEMGIGLDVYRSLLKDLSCGPLLSLEDLAPGADPAVASESDRPDGRLERKELIDALADGIRRLPERERRVVELYYHEGLNMKEVGSVLGVTESRVCQMHAQAATRLRGALSARLHAGPALAGEPEASPSGRRP